MNIQYADGECWGEIIFRSKGRIEYLDQSGGVIQQQYDSSYNSVLYHIFINRNCDYNLSLSIIDSLQQNKLVGIFISNIDFLEKNRNKGDYSHSKVKVAIDR